MVWPTVATMFRAISNFFKNNRSLTFDVFVTILWTFLSVASEDLFAQTSKLLFSLPLSAAAGLAVFWRRKFPLHVFGFQAFVIILLTVVDVTDPVPLGILCGTYSLAAYVTERRHSIIAFACFVAAGMASVLFTEAEYLDDAVVVILMLTLAWIAGDNIRTRRAYRQSLIDRAERAEALQESLALQAVAEERTRIARDLHDVVAHSMSLMVVQAGAARRVATSNPDASMAALEAIESVGRNSLDEMRRILGVLRGEGDAVETAPQPDIAAIDGLVGEFQAAGLPVDVTMTGDTRPLPASIELTAFRIVQEALTNTLKHAGPANATVQLDYEPALLRVTVQDDGASAPSLANGSQKGHVGMRERVAVFGGELTARHRLGGGYHVIATLPLTEGAA